MFSSAWLFPHFSALVVVLLRKLQQVTHYIVETRFLRPATLPGKGEKVVVVYIQYVQKHQSVLCECRKNLLSIGLLSASASLCMWTERREERFDWERRRSGQKSFIYEALFVFSPLLIQRLLHDWTILMHRWRYRDTIQLALLIQWNPVNRKRLACGKIFRLSGLKKSSPFSVHCGVFQRQNNASQ